jgi:hypothetical protein
VEIPLQHCQALAVNGAETNWISNASVTCLTIESQSSSFEALQLLRRPAVQKQDLGTVDGVGLDAGDVQQLLNVQNPHCISV